MDGLDSSSMGRHVKVSRVDGLALVWTAARWRFERFREGGGQKGGEEGIYKVEQMQAKHKRVSIHTDAF